jgi:hypothetical protein
MPSVLTLRFALIDGSDGATPVEKAEQPMSLFSSREHSFSAASGKAVADFERR